MGKIAENIRLRLKNAIDKAIDSQLLIAAGKAAGAEAVNQMIKRTQSGKDINGNKFGGYNQSYKKKLAYKYAVKKYGRTQYASNKASDKLQLTGNLLSSLAYKVKSIKRASNDIIFTIELYIKGDLENKKAEGLQSATGRTRTGSRYAKKKWEFFGLSKKGANVAVEVKAIQKALFEKLQQKFKTMSKVA